MGDCMCNDYDLRNFEWYKAIEGMKYFSFILCTLLCFQEHEEQDANTDIKFIQVCGQFIG